MKNILFLAIVFLATTASALKPQATLDFTNIYSNTNAGLYQMTVTFQAKQTPSESLLYFGTHRDDNDLYCISKAIFNIGTMIVTLVDSKTGWSHVVNKPVMAEISHQSDTETCETNLQKFTGQKNVYAALGLNQPIVLPVVAPFDYQTVAVYLSPFNGYLYLPAQISEHNGKLILNPHELLTAQSILPNNINNNSVTYYVYAQGKSASLSLANGVVKFNN